MPERPLNDAPYRMLVDVGFGKIVTAPSGGQPLMAPVPGGTTAMALAARGYQACIVKACDGDGAAIA